MIIIMENNSSKPVREKPFFNALSKIGTFLTNYHGITAPSQVNYWALSGGSIFLDVHNPLTDGIVDLPEDKTKKNLFDLLDTHGISWKVYLESYPGDCYKGAGFPPADFEKETDFTGEENSVDNLYVRKHNPAISYISVQTNSDSCAKIVNASVLQKDILCDTVPQFAFYVPTIVNDGHNTTATWTNEYLLETWGPLLYNKYFMRDRIISIVYDENGAGQNREGPTNCTQAQPIPLYCTFIGPNVKPHNELSEHYNHYNLLRFVEDHFKLGTSDRCDHENQPITGIIDNTPNDKKIRFKKYLRRIKEAIIQSAGKLKLP